MGGHGKEKRLVVRIQQDEDRVADDATAFVIALLDRVSGKTQPKISDVPLVPIFIRHFFPIRTKPGDVFDFGSPNLSPLKETAATQNRLLSAQGDELLNKGKQVACRAVQLPVIPAQ